VTDNPVHRQALAYAERGWPVFPCLPGRKAPATEHGLHDATTDPARISAWFARRPGLNLAIATGAPGPDVLDIDSHGPTENGYAALGELRRAGLLDDIAASVQTPSGGLHLYLLGSDQRCGHLPARHVDFLAQGGYVLAPPSQADGRPYVALKNLGGDGWLDWTAAARQLSPRRSLRPARSQRRPEPQFGQRQISVLSRWLAAQREGNRNAGLFWAANRALENDPAADLSPLAAAARQAGLDDPEITRTLNSARRTTQAWLGLEPPDHEPEGAR
jgi:Bifunctional DNA primase/polymerase, N-terminal